MNEANKHLEDSIKEAKKNRKRKCCILMIVIIAAIVLVSLIPFIFRVCSRIVGIVWWCVMMRCLVLMVRNGVIFCLVW